MIQATPAPYGMICDPGPCDPSQITLFSRNYEWWMLLLFIVAAFIAGRQLNRRNYLTPMAILCLIGSVIYMQFEGEMFAQRIHSLHLDGWGRGLSGQSKSSLAQLREDYVRNSVTGFLFFALLPFGVGWLTSELKRRNLANNA